MRDFNHIIFLFLTISCTDAEKYLTLLSVLSYFFCIRNRYVDNEPKTRIENLSLYNKSNSVLKQE